VLQIPPSNAVTSPLTQAPPLGKKGACAPDTNREFFRSLLEDELQAELHDARVMSPGRMQEI